MQKGLFYFIMAAILLLTGCDSQTGVQETALPLDTWFPLRVGEKDIQSQVAIQPLEQQRGLMYREEIAQDSGMIFVYKVPRRLTFHMKNTPRPLDIGFFDKDGILREIHRMMPFDTTSTISRSDRIQYALEMNQGWYSRNNLFPGSKLDLNLLAQALQGRGEDPSAYGLK